MFQNINSFSSTSELCATMNEETKKIVYSSIQKERRLKKVMEEDQYDIEECKNELRKYIEGLETKIDVLDTTLAKARFEVVQGGFLANLFMWMHKHVFIEPFTTTQKPTVHQLRCWCSVLFFFIWAT